MIQVPSKVRNLLVVHLGSASDVILTLPTIAQLKLNFPQAKVHWAVEENAYPILKHQPDIIFHIFSKAELKAPLSAAYHFWKLAKNLNKESIDLTIDLQGLFQSGLVTKLSNARFKVGFHRKNTSEGNCLFLDATLPHIPDRTMHRIDYYQKIIPAMGGEIYQLNDAFQFKFLEEEERGLKTLLHRLRLKNPYFVINIGASNHTKRWTTRGFIDLIQLIRKQYPKHSIVLTGTDLEDHNFEREILKNLEPQTVQSSINKINLRELALLVKNTGLLISGDATALHLGCAFSTPSIGLFGSSSPEQYGPHQEAYPGLRYHVPCFPCTKSFCSHHTCMTNLSAPVVFKNLVQLYPLVEKK